MSELMPYVAMAISFGSGAFTAWVFTTEKRPKRVECPNCQHPVITTRIRDHWKECIR